VTDLLPNLDALREALPLSGQAADDARQMVDAVVAATTVDEVDAALDAVVVRWLES
jgi:hypothetical protein